MLDINVEPNLSVDLKMDDNTKDSIDKLVKPAYSLSQCIDDFGYLCLGGIHKKAEIKRITDQSEIESFRNQVNKITEQIPLEDQIPPRKSIIGPALQKAQFYFEESEIRDLFANLIANSIDINKSSKVHPAFPQIIESLSPLDAKLLTLDFKTNFIAPICKIRYQEGVPISSDPLTNEPIPTIPFASISNGITAFNNLFIPKNFICDFNLLSSSITNLARVGLIRIEYGSSLTDESAYLKFLSNSIYLDCIEEAKQIEKDNSSKDINNIFLIKGIVETTPFGEDFISVCC